MCNKQINSTNSQFNSIQFKSFRHVTNFACVFQFKQSIQCTISQSVSSIHKRQCIKAHDLLNNYLGYLVGWIAGPQILVASVKSIDPSRQVRSAMPISQSESNFHSEFLRSGIARLARKTSEESEPDYLLPDYYLLKVTCSLCVWGNM